MSLAIAFRTLSFLAILIIVGLTFAYSHPLPGFLLIGLAIVTYLLPSWGVAVLFVTLSLDLAIPMFDEIHVNLSELEFSVCCLGGMASMTEADWRELLRRFDFRPLLWGAGFFFAVLISGIANLDWFQPLPHAIRYSEMALGMFLAANLWKQRSIWLVISSALVIYLTPAISQLADGSARTSVSSTFANPNQFAAYLNLLLPVVFVLFLASKQRKVRYFLGYLSLLGLALLISTRSFGAIAAAIPSLGLVFVISCHERIRRFFKHPIRKLVEVLARHRTFVVVHLAFVVLLIFFGNIHGRLLAGFQPPGRTTWTQLTEEVSASLETRGNLYRLGFKIWSDNILVGVGPGGYAEAYAQHSQIVEQSIRSRFERSFAGRPVNLARRAERYMDRVRTMTTAHVHNLFLHLALEVGVLGLLGFLTLIGFFIRTVYKQLGHSPLAVAGLGMMIAFLTHNFVDVTYPSLGLEIGLLMGFCIAQESALASAT